MAPETRPEQFDEYGPVERRKLVDAAVATGQAEVIADAILKEVVRLHDKKFINDELFGEVRGAVEMMLEDHDSARLLARMSSMLRYLMENGSYVADNAPLTYMQQHKLLLPGDSLVDLGTGSGRIVREWKEQGGKAIGIDLSPSFVAANESSRFGVIDGNTHNLRTSMAQLLGDQVTINSSLTLDRVADPGKLIQNMLELAGEKGNTALFALLPNNPQDDDSGAGEKIIYTPQHLRITDTGSVERDVRNISQYIEDMSKRIVEVRQGTYRVGTTTDVSEYNDYYGFFTHGKDRP